jgi:hypothetical protein
MSITPLQVKQSVAGYGKADKKQVMEMVKGFLSCRRFPSRTTPPTRGYRALPRKSATSLLFDEWSKKQMFYYLNGTVSDIEPYLAVIDCGGVGYACHTTARTLSVLNKV